MTEIEWIKSGDGQYTARSNAYTITHEARGRWTVRTGHGAVLGSAANLDAAKEYAQVHQDGGTATAADLLPGTPVRVLTRGGARGTVIEITHDLTGFMRPAGAPVALIRFGGPGGATALNYPDQVVIDTSAAADLDTAVSATLEDSARARALMMTGAELAIALERVALQPGQMNRIMQDAILREAARRLRGSQP